jgi:uncharacterized protein
VTPVFLDTVGLLASWDRDDQWHSVAAPKFGALLAARVPLFTTTFVLGECANAAARKPYRLAVDKLRAVMTTKGNLVFPTHDDWDAAWLAYRRDEAAGAGIVDQISFAVMRRLGVTRAFTNDRHFRAAGLEPLF